MTSPEVQQLTSQFVAQLQAIVIGAIGTRQEPPRVPAWPRTAPDAAVFNGPLPKQRRKSPLQLCPSPGCKNAAAPVFGMLCAAHKGTPKRIVAAWRAARRAKKARAGR